VHFHSSLSDGFRLVDVLRRMDLHAFPYSLTSLKWATFGDAQLRD